MICCFTPHLYGNPQYPAYDFNVSERYPDNETSIVINLPTNARVEDGGNTLTSHSISSTPSYGTLNTSTGTTYTYIPSNYNEQPDEFEWTALEFNGTALVPITYKVGISILAVNNPPVFSASVQNEYSVNENQNVVATITVIDYDSDASANGLFLDVRNNSAHPLDHVPFDTVFSSKSPPSYNFNIVFTTGNGLDYESPPFGLTEFTFDLNTTDDAGGSPALHTVTVDLVAVDEAPKITTSGPITRTINEGENTSQEGFQPIQVAAEDYEPSSAGGGVIYWKYDLSDSNIGGDVRIDGNLLSEGVISTNSSPSGTDVNFEYDPSEHDYGQQTITLTAYDAASNESINTIDIVFDITRVDDDPIDLNEPSPIAVSWDENKVGVLHDFDPEDPDSSANENVLVDNNGTTNPEGAKIFYTISGEDKEFFTISNIGELSFTSPPDYENPQDQTGGSLNQFEGNNVYTITVTVRDCTDPSNPLNTEDDQDVTITVNNVNELPTIVQTSYAITVTEDNAWTWDDSMFPLVASDVDSGHQANLNWGVKFANDGDFGTAVISGTGPSPDSLIYTPNFDYDGSSGNDIFIIEITDDANDSIELDFNVTFIAVSDPPRLDVIDPPPNETISVSREVYTIPLDENNPSVVRIDYNEVDGDSITDISFEGGEQILDNEDFNMTVYLAQQYAEISFKPDRIPDFEAPADDNGDGNYSVQLAATESTGKTLSIRLDFIIQDVDDAPEFSPVTNFSPSADENQDFVATLAGTDSEGASQFYWKIDPLYDYIWFDFEHDENTPVATNDLKFAAFPNFENPLDGPESGDKNNTYTVQVRISDQAVGGISSSAIFTVRVSDINDAPIITPIPLNIDEPLKQNASMQLSQYVSDEDNQSGAGPDTITWLEVGGDTDAFALDLNGSLKFNLPSDYETKTSYQILVRASDGRGGIDDANFTIDVNEQSEAPEFFAGPSSNVKISFLPFSLDEDTSITGDISDYTRDPDTNSSFGLTFSTTYDDSNGTFDLQGPSGVYTFTPNANYEGTTYIYVTATDGSNPSTIPLIFDVNDISDSPVVREGNNSAILFSQISRVILENNSSWSMELNASDPYDIPPSTVFLWSLSGPDAPKFKVNPTSGPLTSLTLRATPDYESADDNDTDGVYDVNVTVTDVDNTSQTFNLLLTVLDDDEPAYFIYSDDNSSPVIQKDAGSFNEHTISTSLSNVTVFDVFAQDNEGNAVTYGFTDHNPSDNSGNLGPTNSHYNDNDITLFEINPSTGRIKFKDPVKMDYEVGLGTVSTSKNTYILEVNATDDTSNPDQVRHLIYLTIENVVEEPDFRDDSNLSISSWSRTVKENKISDANFTLYHFSEDDNLTIAYELVGGADIGKFTMNSATGHLEFLEAQDFENPSDSNGDGIYEIEVGIIDTVSRLNLTISLHDQNDAPEITNTGLTQIVVPENTGFVVDIDVLDQDSGKEYPDLIFINGSSDVDFISHTEVTNSVSDFYNGSSNATIEVFDAPSFVVAADFNEDGYEDVVVLNKNLDTIQYAEFDESIGRFSSPSGLTFTQQGPKYCVVTDLNEDGLKDLVVSFVDEQKDTIGWFENIVASTGDPISFGSFQSLQITSTADSTSSIDFDHFAIGDVDGDSFQDIVIARKLNNAVDVYLNDGAASFGLNFSFNTFTKPNYIDLADFDSSGTADLLVSAQGELSLGYSGGIGSDGNVSVAFQPVESYPGAEGRFAKAFDLTRDGKMDIVYATGQSVVPSVIIQNTNGFDASVPLTQNSYTAYSLGYPSDVQLISATDSTRETLVVSDESSQYFSLYEAEATNDGNFKEPVFIDAGASAITKFVVLSDLNASKDIFEYDFNGGEDESSFNSSRFKNDGKLYFNSPFPDFENPTDNGAANRYDVIVKVEDQDGSSTEKTISVTVADVNDKPIITSLDGNWTASFDHNESNGSLYLFTITATNEEPDESLSFSKEGGADAQFFDVDAVTGEVSFFYQPDYENALDSGSDNSYNVLLRVTDAGGAYDEQNVTINILDTYEPPVFGKPIISNEGLTRLKLSEHRGFIVDLEVIDPNATVENQDIVFVSSFPTAGINALYHTEVNSSVSVMYPSSGTSALNSFTNPQQVVSGDFNRDGYEDLFVLDEDDLDSSRNEIHYLEYDDSIPGYASPLSTLNLDSDTNPSFMVVRDLDQDGDLDLVVSFNEAMSDRIGWFENNESGSGLGVFSPNKNLINNTSSQTISHFSIGDLDGDSYDDIAVTRLNGVADIYLNDSTALVGFTWKQNESGNFDKPRYIELVDFDNSGTLDLLISAKNEVLIASNQGIGTDNLISFSYTTVGTYQGEEGSFAKAYDLTGDGLLDIVYSSDGGSVPSVVVQSNTGFLSPTQLSVHQDNNKALTYANHLEIIPARGQNLTTLVFSDDSSNYLSLYELNSQSNGTFKTPIAIDLGTSSQSFVLTDIGRLAQTFEYSIVGGEEKDLFDADRFRDEGKLYFNSPYPDYEYPTDDDESNRYDVIVKVEDRNGESTIQNILVQITDENDPPYISSLDGNWTSYFYHSETNTTLDLFTVVASNTETVVGDELMTYSIRQLYDHEFFEINSTSGLVSLLSMPDYENPEDENSDNNYTIIIRVTDDGVENKYDEQNVTVVILDGAEAPTFGDNNTSYMIIEDSILANIDLNVSDDDANTANGGPGIEVFNHIGVLNGVVTFPPGSPPYSHTFTYTPDDNFSGTESFTIVATNYEGLTDSLDINITVISVNDRPEITTSRIIDIGEGTKRVSSLQANDDSAGEMVWSLQDYGDTDANFTLTPEGLLQFRNHGGVDYEKLADQVEDFVPTDAVNLVLWLDADDNQTLFKTDSFNEIAEHNESGTSVGGWKDKSVYAHHVSRDAATGNRPKIGFINGKTAIDFQGDVENQNFVAATRLGLTKDPDLLIFAVTQVDSSVNNSDHIIQIGDAGLFANENYLLASAGGHGWSWRFRDGQAYFTSPAFSPPMDNNTSLQVWERPAGGDINSSKFYLNGYAKPITYFNGTASPDNESDYIQIGAGFDGRIGEIIVLNSTASDDREKLEGYLAHKWGLTAKLSTDHPYRYNRPSHIKWQRSIRVTDSEGNFTDANFTIRVSNENDNLPVINNPEIQNTSRIKHYEYSVLNNVNNPLIDFNVTDIDGDIVEFNIVGGNDASLFYFDNSSMLKFSMWGPSLNGEFPDYEDPQDDNDDNVYEVEIEITDGNASHTITKLLKIEIINGNEDPPEFTYDGAVVTSLDLNQTENNKTVIQLTSIDDWTGPIEYSITGGTDGSLFEVDATTGLLSFYQAPNFEFPHNNPASNDYQVEITASDENNFTSSIPITVNVTDVNEPPGFGGGFTLPIILNEDNSTTFVMEIYDPEDNATIFPFDFPPKVEPSHGSFIDAGQGNYTYTPNPNYNGSDMIVVTVNDVNLQKDFNVTFQINPVADNPTAGDDDFVIEVNKGEPISLDVLYNDSNLPDANNSINLSILSDGLTQPKSGSVQVVNGNLIHYTPNPDFIGTDSFTYLMQNDSNLTDRATVTVLVKESVALQNWRYLSNIGFYMISGNNWIYHGDLGWLFVQDLSKLDSVTWMWHEKIGWFWTGNEYVPDLYVNDFSSWFRFSSSISNGTYLAWPIYDQENQEWLSLENFFTKQQNLVKGTISQALEGLNSNDEIIDYIETLSFFTSEQIATIKYELKFKGISKTLTALLKE